MVNNRDVTASSSTRKEHVKNKQQIYIFVTCKPNRQNEAYILQLLNQQPTDLLAGHASVRGKANCRF
jgi:hypothetical protein